MFKTPAELKKFVGGTFFTVSFVKRTTGELRVMRGRCGVSKYVTGKGMAYDPDTRGLLVVYDIQKKAYRMVSVEDVVELRARGQVHAGPNVLTAEQLAALTQVPAENEIYKPVKSA